MYAYICALQRLSEHVHCVLLSGDILNGLGSTRVTTNVSVPRPSPTRVYLEKDVLLLYPRHRVRIDGARIGD